MSASDQDILRSAFSDICNGYSLGTVFDKTIYIKHLGYREHVDLEKIKSKYETEARKSGLPTNQEREATLKTKGLWTDSDEHSIVVKENAISRFEDGRKKTVLPSMLKQYDDEILKQRVEIEKLYSKKNELMGLTVETHAEKLLNDFYILQNIFTDSKLSSPLFNPEEFDDLSDIEVSEIMSAYVKSTNVCSEKNIKKLSVQNFFQEYYYLCGDNFNDFFGKPIIQFTYFQIKLGNYAKYFKNIFEHNDISRLSAEKRNDPEAIEDFVSTGKNAQNVLQQQKGRSVGIVGATKDDLKSLGLDGAIAKMPNKEMNRDELFDFLGNK